MVRTVLRETLDVYRALALPLILWTAAIYLPFALVLLALQLSVPATDANLQSLAIVDIAGAVLLFQPLATILAIRTARRREHEEPIAMRSDLGAAFGLLVPFVFTQLLVLAIIALVPGAFIVAGLLLEAPLIALIGLGMLLASAVVNGVRMWLATAIVVVEKARYATAIRRSVNLSHGAFWSVLGVIVALALIVLLVSLIGNAITLVGGSGAVGAVTSRLGSLLVTAVSVPLVAIGAYRLYAARATAQASASD
jgi:hypothetical protein